jgi:hypothetical protein
MVPRGRISTRRTEIGTTPANPSLLTPAAAEWRLSEDDRAVPVGGGNSTIRSRLLRVTVLLLAAIGAWSALLDDVFDPRLISGARVLMSSAIMRAPESQTETRADLHGQVRPQTPPPSSETPGTSERSPIATAAIPAPNHATLPPPAAAPATTPAPHPVAVAPAPLPPAARAYQPPDLPSDPMLRRAAAAGLHYGLSRAVLSRLSAADFENAAVAIRKAITQTPDEGYLVWPPQRSPRQALFRIHFVAGAAPDCRRYVVTITKDGWSTTALPMERCGAGSSAPHRARSGSP